MTKIINVNRKRACFVVVENQPCHLAIMHTLTIKRDAKDNKMNGARERESQRERKSQREMDRQGHSEREVDRQRHRERER